MKETKLLGSLMPSHPDAKPIIEKLREKYNLPEISPDDDPITEIYLDDEIVSLEKFRQEIEKRVYKQGKGDNRKNAKNNVNCFHGVTIYQNFHGKRAFSPEGKVHFWGWGKTLLLLSKSVWPEILSI